MCVNRAVIAVSKARLKKLMLQCEAVIEVIHLTLKTNQIDIKIRSSPLSQHYLPELPFCGNVPV